MRPASLRRVALTWMTGLLAAVGALTIALAYYLAYQDASEFLDGQLRQVALNAGIGISSVGQPDSADFDPEDRIAVTIWSKDGRLLHASLPEVAIPQQQDAGFSNVVVRGQAWRIYTISDSSHIVEVAQRDTVRREIAQEAAIGASVPILLLIPLSWGVVGWATNRMISRLDAVARDLATRSAAASEPIPLAEVPAEVEPLAESMNKLILRLRGALDAQRSFVADAAHELRTPLAAMQIYLDNVVGGDPNTLPTAYPALSSGVRRAGTLVNQLLRLARLDQPQAPVMRRVDIGSVVLECVAELAPLAEQNGIDLGARVDAPALTEGDAEEIRTLFASLLDNALRYTPAGGQVDVRLVARDGRLLAEITDTGIGIPAGEEARIFDRFHRAAPGGLAGSGLGLAIVKRIAERNAFLVSVENRRDSSCGAVARVWMPASPAGEAAS